MGIIAVTIIFLCICVDNMVSANMSSIKMKTDVKIFFPSNWPSFLPHLMRYYLVLGIWWVPLYLTIGFTWPKIG